jgi:O-methyltransferase
VPQVNRFIRAPMKALYTALLKPVYARLARLEAAEEERQQRLPPLFKQQLNRRFMAIDEIVDYLASAQVAGDYLEFGVYNGQTFSHACRRFAEPAFHHMKCVALDSFEGLPKPAGVDALDSYTGSFSERQFACSSDEFLANLTRAGVDLARVTLVKGWFAESLTPATAARCGIDRIAVAWIDCDLYESTVPVLQFITSRLSTGSVVVFDDWRCFRNRPDCGEQRACREWLARNPHITLRELFSFGWHGMAFTADIEPRTEACCSTVASGAREAVVERE